MKALKEKRVSLRSLFRRSLVILSLLALAFAVASCNSDSGSPDPSGPSGPTGGTTPSGDEPSGPSGPRAALTVKSMVVLSHPNKPSFEGAAPVLDGLEVLVKLSDSNGTVTEKRLKGDSFTVEPPVAHVKEAGEALYFQQYTIAYRDEEDFFDTPSYGIKVWIPVIFALDENAEPQTWDAEGETEVGYPDIYVEGKLGSVFEDLGVNRDSAADMKFVGLYVVPEFGVAYGWDISDGTDAASAPTIPGDYGYTWDEILGINYDDYAEIVLDTDNPKLSEAKYVAKAKKNYLESCNWLIAVEYDDDDNPTDVDITADPAEPQEVKTAISVDPKAWLLNKRNSDQKTSSATYLCSLNAPTGSPIKGYDQKVDIEKFYKVDRLDYVDNGKIKDVKVITADDKDLGGNNVKWRFAGTRYVVGVETVGKKVQDAWWEYLLDSGLEFEVIYYVPDTTPLPDNKATRRITMADYVRAMYTVDEVGTPRAALPIFSGAPTQIKDGGVAEDAALDSTLWGATPGNNVRIDPSSPQHWAYLDGDYNLYLNLFYYSDLIKPYNAGDANPSSKGNGQLRPTYTSYLDANPAQIPICTDEYKLVALFTGFDGTLRKDSTKHPINEAQGIKGGEPVITQKMVQEDSKANRYPASRNDLYRQLKDYWQPRWVYENPNNGELIYEKIPDARWYPYVAPETNPAGWNAYQKQGLTDWDFDDIEEIELRDCAVQFPAPPSMGPSEDDEIDVWQYWVKP